MTAHLPALQVLVPMFCAPFCALLRSRTVAWLLFLLAALGALACAVFLALQVTGGQVQRYAMGGWPAPVGIEFVISGFNVPIQLLVAFVAVVVAVHSRHSIPAEVDARRIPLLYTCMCLVLAGMLGITATGDAFNAFVFLEITSLSSYALIALGRHRRALVASFRYLVIGSVGAVFVLIGIGMAYAVTGTLNMADLAERLTQVYGNRALYAAVVFVFIGLAIKMALFPLHAWLPAAYSEAPSAVGMLLSATSTKVAIYLFCRFAFTVFGTSLVFVMMPIDRIGLLLAVLAMLVASVIACFQNDLRYLLAWSSVAQVGYIVAGVSLGTTAGVSAAYLHIINHAVVKAALFGVAGLLVLRLGSAKLTVLAGLARRMPWMFAAIVVAGLGLIGVPPTAGFASKWALAAALAAEGAWPVLVAMLASSLLALVYIGRVVEIAWFRQPPEHTEPVKSPASMYAVVWALVLLSVYFGIDTTLPASLADLAASALLGNGGE